MRTLLKSKDIFAGDPGVVTPYCSDNGGCDDGCANADCGGGTNTTCACDNVCPCNDGCNMACPNSFCL